MPLPEPITGICPSVFSAPKDLCVRMPGGLTMCVNLPTGQIPASASEVSQAILQQINTALAPLQPFFNMLDLFAAIVDCVKAVPEAILQLDPSGIIGCVPGLVEALEKVLAMIPPLSIPIMIADILGVVIAFAEGMKSDLTDLKRFLDRINETISFAEQSGNEVLKSICTSCATPVFEEWQSHINSNAEPVNQMLRIINVLLDLVPGVDPIPCLGSLGPDIEPAIDFLDAFVDILGAIRAALPGGLDLSALIEVPQGNGC